MSQALKIKKLQPIVKEVEAVQWDGSREMADQLISWIGDSGARFYTAAVTNDVSMIIIDSYGLNIRPDDFIVKYPDGKLDSHSLGDGEYKEVEDFQLEYVELGTRPAIDRIKYIRAQTGCDLKQARDFVKYAPGIPGDVIVNRFKKFKKTGMSINESNFPVSHIVVHAPSIPELDSKVMELNENKMISPAIEYTVNGVNGHFEELTSRKEVIAALTVMTILGVNQK